ncbi:MAG: GNAT family N-acetyltransferase [Actinomycetota bacterium]|nr:GNAT family N-acetyltransferase [Actinomycetota bacterium]
MTPPPPDGRPAVLAGQVREALDADSWATIALIGACWAEYPGCVMAVERECPELLAPASYYRSLGGQFWVVPEGGWVAACVGFRPISAKSVELVKLYVAPHRRGRGLGRSLAGLVEQHAWSKAAIGIELWSDSRFTTAHRLYTALGYQADGRTRQLHDLSETTELHFHKPL